MSNVLKEWKDKLDGRQYREELTYGEVEELKNLGIVAMYGASDDLVILSGALDEEEGAWGGTTILFKNGEMFKDKCLDGCPYEEKEKNEIYKNGTYVRVYQESDGWSFVTKIPHEKFTIFDGDERYGDGILFHKESIVGN